MTRNRPISLTFDSSFGLYEYQGKLKDLNTGRTINESQGGSVFNLGFIGNFPLDRYLDLGLKLYMEKGYISGDDVSGFGNQENTVYNDLEMRETGLIAELKIVADDVTIGPALGTKYKYNYFSNTSDQFVYAGTNSTWTSSWLEAYNKDRIFTAGITSEFPCFGDTRLGLDIAYDYNTSFAKDSSVVFNMEWQNDYLSPSAKLDVHQSFQRVIRQKYKLAVRPFQLGRYFSLSIYGGFQLDGASEPAVEKAYGIFLGGLFKYNLPK